MKRLETNEEIAARIVKTVSAWYERRYRLAEGDLSGSCALAAVRALRDFDPQQGTPFQYFAFVYIRTDAAKTAKREAQVHIRYIRAAKVRSGPTEDEDRLENAEHVEKLMRRLSDREKVIVNLRFWSGLSARAIGEGLGMSRQGAEYVLKGALRKMRAKGMSTNL